MAGAGKPGRPQKYTPEFKANATDYVIATGKTYAEAAADLGIPERTLGKWMQARRKSEPERAALEEMRALRRENERLRQENERLRQENEFLKKPRPSSPPTRIRRHVPPDRGGEGQLQHRHDVRVARCREVELLRMDGPVGAVGPLGR